MAHKPTALLRSPGSLLCGKKKKKRKIKTLFISLGDVSSLWPGCLHPWALLPWEKVVCIVDPSLWRGSEVLVLTQQPDRCSSVLHSPISAWIGWYWVVWESCLCFFDCCPSSNSDCLSSISPPFTGNNCGVCLLLRRWLLNL